MKKSILLNGIEYKLPFTENGKLHFPGKSYMLYKRICEVVKGEYTSYSEMFKDLNIVDTKYGDGAYENIYLNIKKAEALLEHTSEISMDFSYEEKEGWGVIATTEHEGNKLIFSNEYRNHKPCFYRYSENYSCYEYEAI